MHIPEGRLRAYLDHELPAADHAQVSKHLAACEACARLSGQLSDFSRQVSSRLADLEAGAPPDAARQAAWERLQALQREKESRSMFRKILDRPYRPAWVVAGLVILLVIALSFAPVRAAAISFLGLFRVQQVQVIQVNPGDLGERMSSATQLEQVLSEQIQIEQHGEVHLTASAVEASQLAGFAVRLPEMITSEPRLEVQPGASFSLQIERARVQAILAEIGRGDIELPAEVDGATVNIELPAAVTAGYGACEVARVDPAEPSGAPHLPVRDCTMLVQLPSPTVSAPPGLDLPALGEAFLQVLGMPAEEAAHFASNIDWATTLVIPIPRYGTSYSEVTVDGVPGTLIRQQVEDHPAQYLLVWAKDGMVYALSGPGDGAGAVELANSLK